MRMTLPDFCLVLLVGASGSGKSSFARRHFAATEILSSDRCRALVADNENDQSATAAAFEVLRFIAAKRLEGRRLAVIDATNVRPEDRKGLVQLARQYHALPVAIVLNLPEKLCLERNSQRPDRQFGAHVVRNQVGLLRRSLRGLQREGFRVVHVLESEAEVESVEIVRQPLWTDRRDDHGPFDIIGDVHGCFDELSDLLAQLGYHMERQGERFAVTHPAGRKAVFLGDLVDRGPRIPDVLRLVMSMVEAGDALCVSGNHDAKLLRKLQGRNVRVGHGLAQSIEQLEAEPTEFQGAVREFLDGLRSHFVLDGGALVVAHAGMKEELQGRASSAVRAFGHYGETTGETDEYGLPVRYDWAAEYRGKASVVYGHTPVVEPEWLNRTICVDTGCVFGAKLTALRWPEKDLVSVPARQVYSEPVRPLAVPAGDSGLSAQQTVDDMLDIDDVLGKRIVSTTLMRDITIREENAAAALEVMSRFAGNPKWLIYLPPTMAPPDTSSLDGLLEHPGDVFDFYARGGVPRVVCEEKHMGSRAVVVVCRDEAAARRRFGVTGDLAGCVHTRTGRPFFTEGGLEAALLTRLREAMDATNFWERFATDWACFDCELMPWSAKARALLLEQYAPVAAAARVALADAVTALEQAAARGVPVADLRDRHVERRAMTTAFAQAYRRYCWPVNGIDDLRLAPFHLLATEGAVHNDKGHAWHMETIAELCAAAPGVLHATPWRMVNLADTESRRAAIDWWTTLTEAGGEGMVVKPESFIATGKRGFLQPAVKCRGREYLRLIYGPEYTTPDHLARLRGRGLSVKRSLAVREFVLGQEALRRFVAGEPLRRVHECVFAILALESEPVDPRL